MNDFKKYAENISKLSKKFESWAQGIDWVLVNKKIRYFSDQLPTDIENESINLMNRGWFLWFLDGAMKDLGEKVEAIIGKSHLEQDQYLHAYVSENMELFKSTLNSYYPDRANQINDAFKSHDLKIYYSSIPVFLALSEGICRDMHPNIGLFQKQKPNSPKSGLPKTDDLFDNISGLEVFSEAVLKPLRVSSDVTKTINNPTAHEKTLLNRHLIMHGNSNSYGTETNSLKAISLLYFVHKSLEHLRSPNT